jgi:hypothetical protein
MKSRFVIFARRGQGPLMHYNGRKFSDHGHARVFADWVSARERAAKLRAEYALLRHYTLSIRDLSVLNLRRKNPETRSELAAAAEKLRDFSGHEADEVLHVQEKNFRNGLVIGPLHGLLYGTVRDGRNENYIHRFRKASRPLLAASSDGRSLRIVGGRFQFTEAGIEDR